MKNELKNRIMEKAREQFKKVGYKNMTTDELAKDLSISKRTLYEYFPSKKELVLESLADMMVKFRDNLTEHTKVVLEKNEVEDFAQIPKIWKMISDHLGYFDQDVMNDIDKYVPEFAKKCDNMDKLNYEQHKKIYDKFSGNGYVKKELSFDLIFLLILGAMQNIMKPEVMANLPLTVPDAVRSIFSIMYTGILTDKGREQFEKAINNSNQLNDSNGNYNAIN